MSQPLCNHCGQRLPNDTGTYCPHCGEPSENVKLIADAVKSVADAKAAALAQCDQADAAWNEIKAPARALNPMQAERVEAALRAMRKAVEDM